MVEEGQNMGFDLVRVLFRKRGKEVQAALDGIAEQVFDAYRAAMDDGFTTQGLLDASNFGFDVKDWDSIPSPVQDTLDALCVRHLRGRSWVETAKLLADALNEYFAVVNVPQHDENQLRGLSRFPSTKLLLLEHMGLQFDNGVRKARILGLKPLMLYREWLVL